MHAPAHAPRPAALGNRPRLEVADIVRAHAEEYLRRHPVSAEQLAVLRALASCRTAALGGHLDVCDACGHEQPSYNSCRNRHCPKCQSLQQARWIEQRSARILPTHYFHVVFTLPEELRPLALRNRQTVFDLLFRCAAETLLDLGTDPRRLGAMIGITAVLHTWRRDLAFHPHLHCIVTGGGLSLDGSRWVEGRQGYLFPVPVIGKLFRGKLLAALRLAYQRGELALEGSTAYLAEPRAFAHLIDSLYRKTWIVYAKPPFGGAKQVIAYLGRYTHRVGISNQRLQHMDAHGVTFRTRGDRTVTLSGEEFLRRFLLHVLPKHFVKIRHYGLMAASHATTTLERARELIAAAAEASARDAEEPREVQHKSPEATPAHPFTFEPRPCPSCHQGRMLPGPLLDHARFERAGPSAHDTS